MKNKITLLAVLTALTASASVVAEDKPVGSGPNPFSDCGIGAALFPKHDVAAVISNVIWDVGTTAVTSATASPETCSGKNAQAAAFIFETYDSLVEDTARGEGEHLSTLLSILKVSADKEAEVVASVRSEFREVISASSYESKTQVEKAEALYSIVSAKIAG